MKNDTIPVGCVICQIDPEYRTYSRKATTFAWLLCDEFEVCQALMERCEQFARIHRVKATYPDTLMTQGDNLETTETISKSQVTHVVIGILFT